MSAVKVDSEKGAWGSIPLNPTLAVSKLLCYQSSYLVMHLTSENAVEEIRSSHPSDPNAKSAVGGVQD